MKSIKTNPAAIGSGNILLIGIGNSGRGDDGLGWKFIDMIKALGFRFLNYEYRYQLQVEDASFICVYDTVIFADASHATLENGFEIKPCEPAQHYFFSSHIQSPEAILYLAKDLYNTTPEAYTLAISGKYWELQIGMSEDAEKNLQKAFTFFVNQFLPTIAPGFTG